MQSIGQLLLIVTFFAVMATALTAITGALTHNTRLIRSARYGAFAVAALNVAMAIILTHGFLSHDFTNKYITAYSDRAMPTIYLLAAFWGGEKGALLFWTSSLSIFGAIALHMNRDKEPIYMAWVTAVMMGALLFFAGLLVFASSPFDTFITSAGPQNGQGLNPLLQNPTMAFHPPSLLTGYIAFTIPFAFAAGALISGKLDTDWIVATRVWTLVSWLFLSIGLLLGALWAYQEIGWGFWWMWDPVENAGLIPWFTATAFLHSVMLQERRGMLKRWNIVLCCLTFFLTIFGTFLTRSQIIDSIHSFANSELATSFVWYLVVLFIASAVLVAWRWRALKPEARIESFWSRESFFVLNNVVLVGCAFIVLWGTLFPKLSELSLVQDTYNGVAAFFNDLGMNLEYLDQAVSLDEPWFNTVMAPIGLVLLLLMGIGPLISWRRATKRNFNRNFRSPLMWSALITSVGTGIVAFIEVGRMPETVEGGAGALSRWLDTLEIGHYYSLICYFFAIFVLLTLLREFHVGARIRQRKFGEGYIDSLVALVFKTPRRYGGYLIHFGVMLMFIAFTGKVFKTEVKDRPLDLGDSMVIDNYQLTFSGRDEAWHGSDGFAAATATISVLRKGETVAEGEVEDLAAWLSDRNLGAFHIETRVNSPKMTVRFADTEARDRLRDDLWLAREFKPNFALVLDSAAQRRLTYRIDDTGLINVVPRLAMQQIREAQQALGPASTIGAAVSARGGSMEMGLTFATADAYARFKERIAGANVPDTMLYARYDAGSGALEFIDRRTGSLLSPQVRYYEAKREGEPPPQTTEAAINSGVFEDLYLAIKDMGGMVNTLGQPVVNIFAVVFPFVMFLWAGGIMVILGTLVCLTPRWLGRTFIGVARAGRPAGRPARATHKVATASILLLALGFLVALSSGAFASALDGPRGIKAPAGDPLADVLGALTCGCPMEMTTNEVVTLADERCVCRQAGLDREVVAELLQGYPSEAQVSGRAKLRVLGALVDENLLWDHRLVYSEADYQQLIGTTKTTCAGERGMVLKQAQITCSVRNYWFPKFRQMLTAGVPVEAIHTFYVDYENHGPRALEQPWSYEDLKANPDKPLAWAFPAALLLGALGWFIGRRLLRTRKGGADAPEADPMSAAALGSEQRLRLEDELDRF